MISEFLSQKTDHIIIIQKEMPGRHHMVSARHFFLLYYVFIVVMLQQNILEYKQHRQHIH